DVVLGARGSQPLHGGLPQAIVRRWGYPPRAGGGPNRGSAEGGPECKAGSAASHQIGQPDMRIASLRIYQGSSKPLLIGGEAEVGVVTCRTQRIERLACPVIPSQASRP